MCKFVFLSALIILAGYTACDSKNTNPDNSNTDDSENGITLEPYDYAAHFTDTPPVIDGVGNDAVWAKAQWKPIDQVWKTPTANQFNPPTATNFSGRYKILWTAERLYYLVEITDDIKSVTRQTANPYNEPYEDDCLELFINEDGQGGSHVSNNNAFAYHLCFDSLNAMDYVNPPGGTGFQGGYIKRNHHMDYKIGETAAPVYIWEIGLKVYDKTCPINDNPANHDPEVTKPVTLTEGKVMGFAIAYNDSDNTHTREYFMGSVFVPGATDNERNQAYQNADVFAKLYLVK
jgi:hypothetical protein